MTKLKRERNNVYYVNRPKNFKKDGRLCTAVVKKVFDFAFDMSFGELGVHRSYRSGGERKRKNGEVFTNAFQGKLAEFAVQAHLSTKGVCLSDPDLDVYGLGEWDNYDFIYNNYKIAVKSTKHYGQLLLLETKDWNSEGEYIPNKDKSKDSSDYDFFILVRIKPSIEDIMKGKEYFYNERIVTKKMTNKEELLKKEYNILKTLFGLNKENSFDFEYDIPGTISKKTLQYIIDKEYILPQNSYLSRTKIDAENYYVQAGNMKDIDMLVKRIK